MQRRQTRRLTAAIVFGLVAMATLLKAQTSELLLWPNGAPGSEAWTRKEVHYKNNQGLAMVRNVVQPSITAYPPATGSATGTAVIVAPGGAFRFLSWESEGTLVADWLRQHGVAAFVLKYRLTDTGTDEEFQRSQARGAVGRGAGPASGPNAGRGGGSGGQVEIRAMAAVDGLQAVKVVREHAAQWGVDPGRIGLMGFSAGGYVAAKAGLQYTAETRPNFVAPIYACCMNMAEEKVPEDAPPMFLLHAYNDPVSTSSPSIYLAWKAASRPAELHSYGAGGHGFGMPRHDQPTDGWIERFGDWLRYQKLMR